MLQLLVQEVTQASFFASYINGFATGLQNPEPDLNALIETSETAYSYAYSSISRPVEGTMITVMRAWAHALKEFKKATSNAIELFLKSF